MNQRLINSFMDLVRIDSESGNEEAVISFLRQILERELDAQCLIDDYGNLLARIGAKGCPRSESIALSTHADTVKPGGGIEPILVDDFIRSKGNTILGGDDKAGIAEILEALRSARKHPPIEWIVTRNEEIGLLGAKHFDPSNLKAKMGFLLDSDAIDTIVTGGPSHVNFEIEITGRAAHAGMEPEKGISAIQAAAYSISRMKLGRLDEESTANVGVISGGTVRNAVPAKATILAECRSLNHEKCMNQSQAMKALFEEGAKALGASAAVKMELDYRAVEIPENARAVTVARRALERCGIAPKLKKITGGTDASIFNDKGIQMAILGIGVRDEHTTDESVSIPEMEKTVEVLESIFADMCQ